MGYSEIVLVVDRSVDIAATEADIITQINAFVATQQAYIGGDDAKLTLIMFDDLFEFVWYRVAIADVPVLTSTEFYNRGRIAVKDAIGRAIIEIYGKLGTLNYAEQPDNVTVFVMSYGVDAQSMTFRVDGNLEDRVDLQEASYSWDFRYLGTNQVSAVEAVKYGIPVGHATDFTDNTAGVTAAINGAGANSFLTVSHDARSVPSTVTTIVSSSPLDMVVDNTGFTVDVLLTTTVAGLIATLTSTDATTQTYVVTDIAGTPKVGGDALVTTDILVVTAENTVTTNSYDLTTMSDVTDIVAGAPLTYVIDNPGLTLRLPAATDVTTLTAAIAATDASTQTYAVTDNVGTPKTGVDVIVSTDILIVTCELGTYDADYAMTVFSAVTDIVSSTPTFVVIDNPGLTVSVDVATIVSGLTATLSSTDTTTQTYEVTDNVGVPSLPGDPIVTTDILVVTAEDGVATASYVLTVLSTVTDIVSGNPIYIVDNALLTVLVPTVNTVAGLIAVLTATDASVQAYAVTDAGGAPRAGGDVIIATDILEVTSENGAIVVNYTAGITSIVTDLVTTQADSFIINNPGLTIVVTPCTVNDLLTTLSATDASGQAYAATATGGAPPKAGGDAWVNTDEIQVTAEDTVTVATYVITVLSHVTDIVSGDVTYVVDNALLTGLVPGGGATTCANLIAVLTATDASVQAYQVTTDLGVPRAGGDFIVVGDHLVVTAENTVGTAVYELAFTSTDITIISSLPDEYIIDNPGLTVVATPSTVGDLLATLTATDSSNQTYGVTDALFAPKIAGDPLVSTDILDVTAEDTVTTAALVITVMSHVTDIVTSDGAIIVDNPGLTVDVPTGYQVIGLTSTLTAIDASVQVYAVTDSLGNPKVAADFLVTTDILVVTAENTVGTANYVVTLV